jgi:3,4-dihydroxy 2-butanone 4-phosphate synthase/GTP cyclohydrolase II
VLERTGHTEATLDLLRLAKLAPVGVICEILNAKGQPANGREIEVFARKNRLVKVSIQDLIAYRLAQAPQVEQVVSTPLATDYGAFTAVGFWDSANRHEYIALVKGRVARKKNVLVRVHSGCVTGDIFHSRHCDCRKQLETALRRIGKEGRGVLLYIPHHEGRGIGLLNKLKAYEWQRRGLDTIEANHAIGMPMDKRDFGIGAQILRQLGLSTIRILTNNPKKLVGLSAFGLRITRQIPLRVKATRHSKRYLRTKKEKMGHRL